MQTNYLFTIITINLNNKNGLKRTLDGVINQTYQNFEYIVIDGNSTDGSKELIEKYQDNIDYWISEPDKGIYNAMNKGIKVSKGNYLLFLNSGDELFNSNVLEENYKKIHSKDLIYFDLLQVFENSTNEHNFHDKLDYTTFIEGSIGHPTTFIKKKLFDKIGLYDETLKIVSDWKFFSLAIIKYNCSYKRIPKILSRFYMNGICTLNVKGTNNEREKVLNEYFFDYLRLYQLEKFIKKLKSTKIIKLLRSLKLLNVFKKI